MNPRPKRRKHGLVVRPEARRLKIELMPMDVDALAFIMSETRHFGPTKPHELHEDMRVLHVHPAFDFEEVVAYFESYNDAIDTTQVDEPASTAALGFKARAWSKN